MAQMCCKRCGANEDRINGFCSVECEEYYRLEEEINALDNVILERGAEIGRLNARIAELKELLDTESQLSNQFYLLLVDNPKSKKLADDLIEALRINGKEVQE